MEFIVLGHSGSWKITFLQKQLGYIIEGRKKNPAKVSKQNFWLTKSLNHKATRDKDSALGKCLFASSGNGWRNNQETGHQAGQPSAPSWHGCFCCDGRAGLCNSSDVFSKGWIYVYKLYSWDKSVKIPLKGNILTHTAGNLNFEVESFNLL